MSTWGAGNFESNASIETAQRLIDRMTAGVQQAFDVEGLLWLHVDRDDWLVQQVELIRLLCEHCDLTPPQPPRVEDWKNRFLAVYDDQLPGFGSGSPYRDDRRAVVVETFDALVTVSRRQWEVLLF